MPYGFTRDPRTELCLPSPKERPEIVDSIQPIERGAQIIWWHYVEYDFGEVEPGWQMFLWVSNPFDMHCEVMIRSLSGSRTLPKHLSDIEVKLTQSRHKKIVANGLGRLYPKSLDHSRNSLFVKSRTNSSRGREWGKLELDIANQKLTTVAPSSLFSYVHGVTDYVRDSEKYSTNYGPQALDPRIPFYRPCKDEIDARILVGGSGGMFFTLFHELTELYPELKIKPDFHGNKAAFESLIQGKSDLVMLSRELTTNEVKEFKDKFGQSPIPIEVAINRAGIFVHPENPLTKRGLKFAEADAIFSTTRKRGYEKDISHWGDLGLKGEWVNKPIQLYATWAGISITAGGDTALFDRQVIKNGKFKEFRDITQMRAAHGTLPRRWWFHENIGVDDRFGIGFGTVRQKHDSIEAIPLGNPPVLPTAGNCYRGDYPLMENVYFILLPKHLRNGGSEVANPAIRELLKFSLCRQGQQKLWLDSLLPLSYDLALSSANKVGIRLPIRNGFLNCPPAIAGILSKTHSKDDLELLVVELSAPIYATLHPNPTKKTVRIIREWRRSKNLEPLIEAVEFFDDSCSAVSAAAALVTLGRDEYWTNLREYSRHRHKRLRDWLVHEVKRVRKPESIEILIELISDEAVVSVAPKSTVGDAAVEALRSLTNQDFGDDELKWNSWWDSIGKTEFSKLHP